VIFEFYAQDFFSMPLPPVIACGKDKSDAPLLIGLASDEDDGGVHEQKTQDATERMKILLPLLSNEVQVQGN
jgi:hypothetical protein